MAKDSAVRADGVTAIYIPPSHDYWSLNLFLRETVPSLYFMARHGMPIIAGARPEIDNAAYSYPTAKANGGTLRPLARLGGTSGLCSEARDVGVSNVVVFGTTGVEANFHDCRQIAEDR